jgi:endonuclease/exonuclease/phosphatase family metal-dependent hydrolase
LRSATDGEHDLLLLGDFNTTGAREAAGAEELDALTQVLAQAGLRRVPADLECSAYWDGPRRDAWKIPTLLDHVWSRGLAESGAERARVAVHGACRRHACADLRSTPSHPDRDYVLASDHCPLLLELEPGDDDAPGEPPKTGPGATLPPS